MTGFHPVIRRTGVTASEMHSRISEVIPVQRVSFSTGFTPSAPVKSPLTRYAPGASAPSQRSTFSRSTLRF